MDPSDMVSSIRELRNGPFKNTLPPRNGSSGGQIAAIVISVFVTLSIISTLIFQCIKIKKLQEEIESNLKAAVPRALNDVFKTWDEVYKEISGFQVTIGGVREENDAPTIEKFLKVLEKEKPIRFTSQDLVNFTNNYSKILGSGGFGMVHEGRLPNGVKIAVKVLKGSLDRRAEEQFMAEVGTIGRTYHLNLLRLYGFCYDSNANIALVYEHMKNGSLDKFLFGDSPEIIEWEKLHEIAIGTAKGIAYLHEECRQRIIHYDIKPGNILLDEKFGPKVADFGLAKLCHRDQTHISMSGFRGTPGYVAPEFLMRNFAITYKCDVYSFGMVLFEIVGRRKNSIAVNSNDSLNWFPGQVWDEYEKGKLDRLIISHGMEERAREKAERMAMVALWCVQQSPDDRPPMSVVVKMLEGGVEIMQPPMPFTYLMSSQARGHVLMASSNSSGSISSEQYSSIWYKENTSPIMRQL